MTQNQNPIYRHVIAASVTNEPGVLAQVAGMFAARGFNIDSLVVGRTENPDLSRMTIVVVGDDAVLEQVRKQLQKLVPIVQVVDYEETIFVERDLMLVQVSTEGKGHKRGELIELANLFRAKVVDVSPERLLIELSGTEDKIEAFIQMIEPYGIVELARTGVIAMSRGSTSASRRVSTAPQSRQPKDEPRGPSIDPGDLPPG